MNLNDYPWVVKLNQIKNEDEDIVEIQPCLWTMYICCDLNKNPGPQISELLSNVYIKEGEEL